MQLLTVQIPATRLATLTSDAVATLWADIERGEMCTVGTAVASSYCKWCARSSIKGQVLLADKGSETDSGAAAAGGHTGGSSSAAAKMNAICEQQRRVSAPPAQFHVQQQTVGAAVGEVVSGRRLPAQLNPAARECRCALSAAHNVSAPPRLVWRPCACAVHHSLLRLHGGAVSCASGTQPDTQTCCMYQLDGLQLCSRAANSACSQAHPRSCQTKC